MMSADENTPIRGAGQNGKAEATAKQSARKRGKRSRKVDERAEAKPDPIAPAEMPTATAEAAAQTPASESAPEALVSAAPAEREQTAPVSLQTITNAYGDYTRKSIEQTSSFFEQLAGTRSFDRALELQSEFAKQAYETFLAESRKIRELHRELSRQRWQNLEGLLVRKKPMRSA